MEEKIKDILNNLKPFLNEEGGDIEFVKLDKDGYLYIKLTGACTHCLYQDNTTDNLLLFIQEKVPEVKGIINVEI